jgi:hypothetical protein
VVRSDPLQHRHRPGAAGALQANGVPPAAVTVLTDLRREAMLELLQLHD